MVDITLFEVHLDDSNLTANAPFSSGRKEVEAGDDGSGGSSGGGKGKLVGALVGLVFLAVVAFVVRKKVFGGGEGDEELEVSSVA